jgi:hypothetical protein
MEKPKPKLNVDESDLYEFICSRCTSDNCNEDNSDECETLCDLMTVIEQEN